MIINLCERFHCLPSALLKEDASLLRMVRMVDEEREHREGTDDE